jgi:hypothetical protein
MAFVLAGNLALVVIVLYCIASRQYQSWNEKINEEKIKKQALFENLIMKDDEMAEMKNAWSIDWDEEVEIYKRLAAGAYGEVWSGKLYVFSSSFFFFSHIHTYCFHTHTHTKFTGMENTMLR